MPDELRSFYTPSSFLHYMTALLREFVMFWIVQGCRVWSFPKCSFKASRQKKTKKDVENDNLETCMLSSEADFHALGFPYSSAGCFSGRRRGHLDSR